jgi:hypothetical protein
MVVVLQWKSRLRLLKRAGPQKGGWRSPTPVETLLRFCVPATVQRMEALSNCKGYEPPVEHFCCFAPENTNWRIARRRPNGLFPVRGISEPKREFVPSA